MDIWKALNELHSERQRLSNVIATLEALQKGESLTPSRRGRKNMPQEERRVVSERMKKYWASRRQASRSTAAAAAAKTAGG